MTNFNFVVQLQAFLTSPYIWAPAIAYLTGQTIKTILEMRKCSKKRQKITIRDFFASGNMPSTHTAFICSLTMVIGMLNGFGSPIFALALGTTLIVGYDATHVRRAVGEHGLVLRELIDRDHDQEKLLTNLSDELCERGDRKAKRSRPKGKLIKPYFSRGHLPREMLAGAVLGIVVGFVVGWVALL